MPIRVIAQRAIMMNYKFHLVRRTPRAVINLGRLIGYLAEMKQEAEEGRGGGWWRSPTPSGS